MKKKQLNYVKVSKEMFEELDGKISQMAGDVKANEDEFRLPTTFCHLSPVWSFEQSDTDTDKIDVHI